MGGVSRVERAYFEAWLEGNVGRFGSEVVDVDVVHLDGDTSAFGLCRQHNLAVVIGCERHCSRSDESVDFEIAILGEHIVEIDGSIGSFSLHHNGYLARQGRSDEIVLNQQVFAQPTVIDGVGAGIETTG